MKVVYEVGLTLFQSLAPEDPMPGLRQCILEEVPTATNGTRSGGSACTEAGTSASIIWYSTRTESKTLQMPTAKNGTWSVASACAAESGCMSATCLPHCLAELEA